jgi:hypothetical protein
MTKTRSHYGIEPLSRNSKYSYLAICMEGILCDCNLWDYSDGTKAKPAMPANALPSTRPTTAQKKWLKKDRTALSAIHMRVSDNVRHYVLHASTLHKAWEMLHHVFISRGLMAQCILWHNLFNMRCNENNNVSNHLDSIALARTALADAGQIIGNKMFKNILVQSLPHS